MDLDSRVSSADVSTMRAPQQQPMAPHTTRPADGAGATVVSSSHAVAAENGTPAHMTPSKTSMGVGAHPIAVGAGEIAGAGSVDSVRSEETPERPPKRRRKHAEV